MKTNLYSIYDRKANFYSAPFSEVNEVCAIRQFQSQYAQHPYKDDFELYFVGEYDNETGIIFAVDKPQFIVSYSSFAEVK